MGAGIMVTCDKKVLILKRAHYKGDPYSGYWNFPGGTSEVGESAYDTAVRETSEEIGISVPFIKVVDHVESKGYTMFIGKVSLEFTPEIDEEHTDFKWVDLSSIPSIEKLHPKDRGGFEKYVSRR